MADVTSLDSALSKPQLLRVIRRAQKEILGMHQIAEALSEADLEFAQEAFEVFARKLDHISYDLNAAIDGDQEWYEEEFGPRRKRG